MKKILITGADSYIGTSFDNWCGLYPDQYEVSTLDVKDSCWCANSFKGYDVVFHVAGIAHVTSNTKQKELYHSINCELAYETARKAKNDGVKQFIFMSSIKVYGEHSEFITKETIPEADSIYGESKLQAEIKLKTLESDGFKIVIIRAPMIYGKDSKGNFPKLVNLAKRVPVFPRYENCRSMLHIDNLCEFVRLMIENHENGVFFPQNTEYVSTYKMIESIRRKLNKKTILTKIFNWFLKLFIGNNALVTKIFGNLAYDKKLSIYKDKYCVRSFSQSIDFLEKKS